MYNEGFSYLCWFMLATDDLIQMHSEGFDILLIGYFPANTSFNWPLPDFIVQVFV